MWNIYTHHKSLMWMPSIRYKTIHMSYMYIAQVVHLFPIKIFNMHAIS
jgi:hypothetical protein